jgi:(R,R)-butanediol dehydrogenase/meso-butanediol dehydrogenase/diacetyl reductase
MKAAVTTQDGGFELQTLPDPTPAPDQLVIRIGACGVCGSDLKAHGFMAPGTVMGHEMCGEVVAAGRKASGWRQGTSVAVLPVVCCGSCAACLRGEVAHCASVRFIGMGTDAGGFAEFAAVPAAHAFRLPEGMPNTVGALVEPFAVGLHAATAADIGPGSRVLVVGAGGVGLTVAAWARALGAQRITVADPVSMRRTLAETLGATDVLESAAEADVSGYDAVLECVGRPELFEVCLGAARARGHVVMAGACEQPVHWTPISALLKELTVRFSIAYLPQEFRRVVDAFASGTIDPSALLGPSFELHRVGEAFDRVRTATAAGRVLVAPRA